MCFDPLGDDDTVQPPSEPTAEALSSQLPLERPTYGVLLYTRYQKSYSLLTGKPYKEFLEHYRRWTARDLLAKVRQELR